jgi:DUF4097 and DUF4098 domain-containing protein YvlB
MASWEFPTAEPVDLQIRIPAGIVLVTAGRTRTSTVQLAPQPRRPGAEDALRDTLVEYDAGRLVITAPDRLRLLRGSSLGLKVTVTVPHGSTCTLDTGSADISCTGELSELNAHTASGDVAAERITGPAEVHTSSGDVRLGSCGPLRAKTVSGDVRIGAAAGDLTCQTVSGQVEIASAGGGRVDIQTTSGDVRVGLAPGRGVQLDLSTLSGTVGNELQHSEPGGEVSVILTCGTVSGDIRVSRAVRGAAA